MMTAPDSLTVTVTPKRWINRALTQNKESIFDAFEIVKEGRGDARGVRVDIELHTGAAPVPYRASFDLTQKRTDLANQIDLPLAWVNAGQVTGRTRTNMVVRVSHGDRQIYCRTHAISILAPGEWVDDDEHRHLLPSFVLPYDPAVRRVVAEARASLAAIADDPAAGFDGYQSTDEDTAEGALPVCKEGKLAHVVDPDGNYLIDPRSADAYAATQKRRGPKRKPALTCRYGNSPGKSFSVKALDVVKGATEQKGKVRMTDAEIPEFETAAVKFSGRDMQRCFILERATRRDTYEHGSFFIEGMFKIVEKVNGAAAASRRFKEFEPA